MPPRTGRQFPGQRQSPLVDIVSKVSKEDSYNQGMEFFVEDKFDEAAAAYLRALDEDPNYADALHALAMTYSHQEKFDQAIEVGKRLIEATPDDELAYTSLSIFYQQKGLIAEAEAVAAKARTLSWKRQLSDNKAPTKS